MCQIRKVQAILISPCACSLCALPLPSPPPPSYLIPVTVFCVQIVSFLSTPPKPSPVNGSLGDDSETQRVAALFARLVAILQVGR